MIGYVTLGTNDIKRSGAFYDELLSVLGAKRMMASDTFIAWGTSPKAPALSVITPYDGKDACIGNGVMVALRADSTDQVDALHKRALELGADDEGAPGPRGANSGFYAGYFRDPDGNKLNAFHFASSA